MTDTQPAPTLHAAGLEHVREIMGWFPDRDSLFRWGSPFMHYPVREDLFLEDIHWGRVASRVALSSEEGRLMAFGQYYRKFGRCHLARLVVAPCIRRQGLGTRFIRALMSDGGKTLDTRAFSLFVLTTNEAAYCCYRKLGFTEAELPEGAPSIENCIFMLRNPDFSDA